MKVLFVIGWILVGTMIGVGIDCVMPNSQSIGSIIFCVGWTCLGLSLYFKLFDDTSK